MWRSHPSSQKKYFKNLCNIRQRKGIRYIHIFVCKREGGYGKIDESSSHTIWSGYPRPVDKPTIEITLHLQLYFLLFILFCKVKKEVEGEWNLTGGHLVIITGCTLPKNYHKDLSQAGQWKRKGYKERYRLLTVLPYPFPSTAPRSSKCIPILMCDE